MDEKRMTLSELVEKVREVTPYWDDRMADILSRYPDLRSTDGGFALGRLTGIAVLDFLCWAFDRPTLGYVPPELSDP